MVVTCSPHADKPSLLASSRLDSYQVGPVTARPELDQRVGTLISLISALKEGLEVELDLSDLISHPHVTKCP